jgi:hypothetical protein
VIRIGVLLAAAVLLLAGCSTDPEPADESPAEPTQRTVRLHYSAGQVSGDVGAVEVPVGTAVTLVVSGETADELHVHGYDRYLDVPAGSDASLTLVTDVPGVFDVELHELGVLLTQLRVGENWHRDP